MILTNMIEIEQAGGGVVAVDVEEISAVVPTSVNVSTVYLETGDSITTSWPVWRIFDAMCQPPL